MALHETKSYEIRCDTCQGYSWGKFSTEELARAFSAQHGWQVYRGDDLCPKCLRARDQEYQRFESERLKAVDCK